MPTVKVAITLEKELLGALDGLVQQRVFSSRSQAISAAVAEKLGRMRSNRLARECAKLDPEFERQLAEEGFSGGHDEWPKY